MRFAIGACFVAAISYQATTQNRLAPLTVLRIAAGPHGEVRNGDFVLDEERTQFDSSKDRAVVVYFQWQGQPGVHRMTALWKSPAGAMLTTSPVEYEAKDRRFGAFWSLTLSEEATVGTWSIEATVDGQPGGRFTFEIVPRTAGRAAPGVRRVLTHAELIMSSREEVVVSRRRNT